MAQRGRSKSKALFSARSETRSGYTIPTIKKIKSVLRTRSKTFLIACIMSLFSKLPKTQKIRFLMKIDRRGSIPKIRKTRRKAKKRTKAKSRKAPKRRTSKSKKPRTAKQKRADKANGRRLKALNKKRRR